MARKDLPGYPSKPSVPQMPPKVAQPAVPPPKPVTMPKYSHLRDRLGHD